MLGTREIEFLIVQERPPVFFLLEVKEEEDD